MNDTELIEAFNAKFKLDYVFKHVDLVPGFGTDKLCVLTHKAGLVHEKPAFGVRFDGEFQNFAITLKPHHLTITNRL